MHLLTPTFTSGFKCIADQCTYSCCKNWTIVFNEEHRSHFINNGILDIDNYSKLREPNVYVMTLDEDGNCPYLEENGLCRMITSCGDDSVLCDICQLFPRIIKKRNGIIEYTLSNACPAVLEILHNTPCPITFELVDINDDIGIEEDSEQELIACRDTLIDLMQISDFQIWTRLYIIYSFAKKIKSLDNADSLISQYNSVEYLLSIYNQMLGININMHAKLQYMVNYLAIMHNNKTTDLYEKHYISLFKLSQTLPIAELSDSWLIFDELFSKYNSLMENIAVNDIYRNIKCNTTDDLFYSVSMLIIMMSLIKFTTFLEWINNEKSDISSSIYNIIACFARKFEHIDYNSLKKYIIDFENEGWLENGNIFTLLK